MGGGGVEEWQSDLFVSLGSGETVAGNRQGRRAGMLRARGRPHGSRDRRIPALSLILDVYHEGGRSGKTCEQITGLQFLDS